MHGERVSLHGRELGLTEENQIPRRVGAVLAFLRDEAAERHAINFVSVRDVARFIDLSLIQASIQMDTADMSFDQAILTAAYPEIRLTRLGDIVHPQ